MLNSSDGRDPASPKRLLVQVRGIVQGVGFRPFVHELACRLELGGWVRNQGGLVTIQVEGGQAGLERFLLALRSEAPPLARIDEVDCVELEPLSEEGFRILASQSRREHGSSDVLVSPDIGTCPECLSELFDSTDRRFGYAFLNCVNCGPRLTLIEAMPYDRERTTMKFFELCHDCRSEYEDPRNRRYHAQPVACPRCGPKLSFIVRGREPLERGDPIRQAADLIRTGGIVAAKSLGGYHLVCDARDSDAVRMLRTRKRREDKPLAIMVEDLKAVERLCQLSKAEKAALLSARKPIVLLRRKEGTGISAEVCKGSPELGIMLPYTPLHHLLTREMKYVPLVMTSANGTDEPMAYDDEDAIERLQEIADAILIHDRPIRVRCDDSVLRICSSKTGSESAVMIRRSRGFAPEPVSLPLALSCPVLALGAQLKNTFSLGSGRNAVLSHHIGNLHDRATFRAYVDDIAHYEALFELQPRVLAHDLHPGYAPTRYAQERARNQGSRLIAVQHHHAHMASCMAENGLTDRVIGVTFDGTGLGTDGKIWGGEFLLGDLGGFQRMAHLRYVAMPGGDKAIREPWRMAVSHLLASGQEPAGIVPMADTGRLHILRRMIEQGLNSPLTSSMGRLFDAMASLIGIRHVVSFEGQGAMELEWLAAPVVPGAAYEFSLTSVAVDSPGKSVRGRRWVADPSSLVRNVVTDRRNGVPGPEIARRFHSAVVNLIIRICEEIRLDVGVNQVVLSGGVFMNTLILRESIEGLKRNGFQVFTHRLVPPNDGGLSLGQLAVAAALLEKEATHVSGDPWQGGGDIPRA